ncbi:MAG: DUF1449 family protein [Candidatus Portnoybacteria bacterium]|nr:DUF1449 family protein [Candidatus Portnoybacteria bacterium]
MSLHSLIYDWYNAVFFAAIVAWFFYLLFELMHPSGSGADISAEHDHDFDHDHDIDLGHSYDHDHDHDTDHDIGHAQEGIIQSIFNFMGIGKCPLGIVLMVFGISWGFIGLVSNSIFVGFFFPPILYFWFSLSIATFFAFSFTRFVSLRVAKIMPKKGTSAIGPESLVGKIGIASVNIDSSSGRATVSDDCGTIHNVYCRTEPEEDIIPEASEIILLFFSQKEDRFVVKRKPVLQEIFSANGRPTE